MFNPLKISAMTKFHFVCRSVFAFGPTVHLISRKDYRKLSNSPEYIKVTHCYGDVCICVLVHLGLDSCDITISNLFMQVVRLLKSVVKD